jgi:hypothetical protein
MKNKLMAYIVAVSILIAPALFSGCMGSGDDGDTVPPEITSMLPGNADEDVAINTNITIVFSKPVINISNTTFMLERVGSFGSIPATVSYNDSTRTATLNPTEDLEWDTIYLVTITSDVRSRAGVALSPASWVFTTGQEADSIPPTVLSRTPVDNYYVAVGSEISVVFSEQVTNINNSTFYIKKNNIDPPLTATVTYNVDTKTAKMNAGTLEEWTSYTVYLSGTITDQAGNSLSEAPRSFMTNDLTAPQVISKNPQNGDTVPTNAAVSVVFSEPIAEGTFNNSENFKLVRVSPEMTVSAVLTYNDSTKTATLIPSALLEEGVGYRVELSSGIRDRAYNQLFNSPVTWNFTTTAVADTTPPTVSSTTPIDGAVNQSTTDPVTVQFSENVTGVNTSSFILERASDSQPVTGSVIYTAGTRTATFTPLVALTQGVTYRARLTAVIKDVANNSLDAVSWIYTTADTTKPSVVSISPASEAGNIAPNINISVTFSENVTGVSGTSITVNNDTLGQPVSGNVSYVPATMTAVFDPDSVLPNESQFTVTLSNAIKDQSGNSLTTYSWKFYTGIEPDTTPPIVVSPTYPDHATHETNIPIESIISIFFSEPVTGVGASNVMLLEGGTSGTLVASLVSYDAVAKKATILPTSNMKYGQQYTVVVKGGASTEIRDAADNKVASDITWSFDTRADTTKPAVTYRYPEQGTIGVPGNAVSVNVIFSEQVVKGSVENSSNFILEKVGGSAVPCNISYTYDPATGTSSAILTPVDPIEEASPADYRVRLTTGITDLAAPPNTLDQGNAVWTFQICGKDTTPPSVTYVNPASGSSNWTSKKIAVTFSEQVTGVTGSTFYLKDPSNVTVPAVVTYYLEYQTAELVVTGTLPWDTTFTAHMTGAAIRDRANNPMVADQQWTVTTPSDTISPTVTTVWPPNGTTNYPVDASVTATFSEPIQNYSDSTFFLTPSATAPVNYDPDNMKLTLMPSGALQGETTYTVTVKGGVGGIQDKAATPNNMAADYIWSFTTMAVPDETDPEIVDGSRYPPDGATVNLDSSVSVQFSEHIVNYNRITVTRSGEIVPMNYLYNSETYTVTLTPKELLPESATLKVTVPGDSTTGIMDPSFNELPATDTWDFNTIADTVRPDLVPKVTYPTSGMTGVPLKPVITVQFTEQVNGVSKSSFYITGANVPTLYVIYDEESKTATLTPGTSLTNGETYTVNLTSAIRDRSIAQNQLVGTDSGNRTWSFTVSTLPVIEKIETYNGTTWTDRLDGATGVQNNISKIRISFNRLMDETKEWFELYEGASGTNDPSPATPNGYSWEVVGGKSVITYNITGSFKGYAQYQARFYGWGGTFKDDPDNNELNKSVYVGDGYFNFTTAADGTAPSIVARIPSNGKTNVGTKVGKVILMFSEMMYTGGNPMITLNPNPGTITREGWIDGGRTVVYSIPELSASQPYTVSLPAEQSVTFSTVGTADDYIQPSTAWTYSTGDPVRFTGADLPQPLNEGTTYYLIYYSDTRFRLATTYSNAIGGTRINITDSGSGTRTVYYYGPNTFRDMAGNGVTGSFNFTTGTSTASLVVYGESFELSGAPDYDWLKNVTSDSGYDWSRLLSAKSGSGATLSPQNGAYLVKAAQWEWELDDYADIEIKDTGYCNFSIQGSYILSLQMFHERLFNSADRLEVWASGDGNTYVQLQAGALKGIQRYDWSLGSDAPIWQTHYIDLSDYSGDGSVYLRFRGVSAGERGGNVIIDNVKVTRY